LSRDVLNALKTRRGVEPYIPLRNNMERLRCVVERITYTNEQTGFTVIKVRVKGYSELVAVVGNMAAVNVGAVLTVCGEWKNDSKHGRQFAVSSWEETLPANVYGIEKYFMLRTT